ncbi:unnamed protein product [Orchesella dallaii]|uniref:Uncharacterized protein n=1 Tax=Orchesella dallaii TaxID=48710 RepID=A0ABP1RN04_9HEXA
MSGKEDAIPFCFHQVKLKFVSCGEARIRGLAFGQLSSIFDNYIWMCIIILTGTVSGFCYFVESFNNTTQTSSESFKHLIIGVLLEYSNIARALFEQGNPIANKYINFTHCRLATGPFLLMVMVLSNAYKNKNITEITLPRGPIPFDTFDALTNNPFNIYTRIAGLRGFTDVHDILLPFGNFITQNRSINEHWGIFMPSELFLFISGEYNYFDYYKSVEYRLSNYTRFIMNNTKLHPDFVSMFMHGTPTSAYAINRCNQTALFLPDIEAHESFIKLQEISELKDHLYLGKASMFDVDYAIAFGTYMSPKIYDRMRGLEASAIFVWWTDFTVNYMTKIINRQEYFLNNTNLIETSSGKSGMSGNISVVFVLLAVGLAVCICTFALEAHVFLRKVVLVDLRRSNRGRGSRGGGGRGQDNRRRGGGGYHFGGQQSKQSRQRWWRLWRSWWWRRLSFRHSMVKTIKAKVVVVVMEVVVKMLIILGVKTIDAQVTGGGGYGSRGGGGDHFGGQDNRDRGGAGFREGSRGGG